MKEFSDAHYLLVGQSESKEGEKLQEKCRILLRHLFEDELLEEFSDEHLEGIVRNALSFFVEYNAVAYDPALPGHEAFCRRCLVQAARYQAMKALQHFVVSVRMGLQAIADTWVTTRMAELYDPQSWIAEQHQVFKRKAAGVVADELERIFSQEKDKLDFNLCLLFAFGRLLQEQSKAHKRSKGGTLLQSLATGRK